MFFLTFFIVHTILGNAVFYISSAHNNYDNYDDYLNNGLWGEFYMRALVIYGLMILVFFPISLKKDVGSLGNIAVLGTVVLIYLIIVRLVVIKLFLGDYDRNSIFFQRLSKKL